MSLSEFGSGRNERIAAAIPRMAAWCCVAIGVLVLVGWGFGVDGLKTIVPGNTSMKVNTALAFVLSGLALRLVSVPRRRVLSRVPAGCALVIAGMTLAEYVAGQPFGIDEALFRDSVSPLYPGRMAPVTAFSLALIAAALLMQSRDRRRPAVAQGLLLAAVLGPAFGIVGYCYGVPLLYGSLQYTAMAFHTGAGLLTLIFGALFVHPREGMVRIFLARGSAGILARLAIPAAVLVPVLVGFVFLQDRWNLGHPRLGSALTVLVNAAVFAGLIWALAFFLEVRDAQLRRAEQMMGVDSLTGLNNRRYFEQRLNEEIRRSERHGGEFGLILFDVDHFKRLNDTLGHLVGDEVLTEVARLLRAQLRDCDIVCRFGGEEFVAMVMSPGRAEAWNAAERVRRAVEEAGFGAVRQARVTISAGVALYPWHGVTRGQLLQAADESLYAAKESGRNRIVACGQLAARMGN